MQSQIFAAINKVHWNIYLCQHMTSKSFIFSIKSLAKHLQSQLKLRSSETQNNLLIINFQPKTMFFALATNLVINTEELFAIQSRLIC